MAIKAVAHRPWGDRPKAFGTWYEPFSDAASIKRGVRFALSTDGVHAICTPGDVALLPDVLAAATTFEPMTQAERAATMTEAADWPTVFPLAEHARG